MPLADEEVGTLLATIPEERRKECWWLILRDGTPLPGDGGGGVAVLLEMETTRPIGRALGALRLGGFIDAVDKLVAGQRKWMGKFLPNGPAPRRYP